MSEKRFDMKRIWVSLLFVLILGCQSNQENRIIVYSGGKVIKEYISKGRVTSVFRGHRFIDKETGQKVQISYGSHIIERIR